MKYNPLEGTDGVTITVANSDDNGGDPLVLVSLNGETGAYETTGAIFGTSSLRMATATAANPCQIGFTDTAATSARARWYIKFTTLPTTAVLQFGVNFRGNTGGTSLARTEVNNADGKYRVVMGATTGSYSALALQTGVEYDFEAVASGFNGSSGTMTVNCYLKSTGALYTSATVSGATTAFTCDTGRFGKFAGGGNFDALFDAIAFETGSAVEIGPYARSLVGTDAFTFAEGTPNIKHVGTDTFTLSQEAVTTSAVAVAATDVVHFDENVAETTITDLADVSHMTDVVTSLTVAASRTDVGRFGDSPARSIPTGAQGFSWGGGFLFNYVVVAVGDEGDLAVGQYTILTDAAGTPKEDTIFQITSITPPFAGFVNVFLYPDPAAVPANGDLLKVVTPAGALVHRATPLVDSVTFTEDATGLHRASARTDSFTMSESAARRTSNLVGSAAETDVAQPVGRVRSRVLGIATKTDAARPLAQVSIRAVGLAAETDAAQPVARRHARAAATAAETDTAVPLAARKTRAVGQTAEVDAAQALAHFRFRALGLAAEVDAAVEFPLGTGVHVAPEQDESRHLTAMKSKTTTGIPSEVDAGLPLTARHARTPGPAPETDIALPLTARRARAVGVATSTETGLAFGHRLARTVGVAVEPDVARPLASGKTRAIGRVDEVDGATAVVHLKPVSLHLAEVEFDRALAFTRGKTRTVARADETDAARPIPHGVPGLPVAFRIRTSGREGITDASGEEPGTFT
jgi:hypothetical protein